jgi:cob(I)alamin adenosyltransferase
VAGDSEEQAKFQVARVVIRRANARGYAATVCG